MRRLLIEFSKIAISLGMLWLAFSKINTESVVAILRSIPVDAVLALVAVLAFQLVVAGYRLHCLLALLRAPLSTAQCVDTVFVGAFFSQTFFSFIGGDAMRAFRLAAHEIPVASAVKAVVIDRIVGFVGLFAMITIGLPLLFDIVKDTATRATVVAVVSMGLLGTVAFLLLSRIPESTRRWRPVSLAANLSATALSIARQPRHALKLVGLSILIQATNALGIFLIALGLGVHAGLLDLMLLVPLVMLLAMLPISFAGWGVREGAMALAMGLIGVGAEQSIAMSICFGACLIVCSLPGGIVWLLASGKAKQRMIASGALDATVSSEART